MNTSIISKEVIAENNRYHEKNHRTEFNALAEKLLRKDKDINEYVQKAIQYTVSVPSWGVGTGGTRFARFPGSGEPRHIEDKLDDCAVINQLTQCTPNISLHLPWDKTDDARKLKMYAKEHGLGFDAMNSNTFQDQPDQLLSYKFGSLTHVDKAVRKQAIEHNIECVRIGKELGSKALTIWIADGSNFPGQSSFTQAYERYIESASEIYGHLPDDWRMFLEHKIYEPAFYSTVIQDWGSSCLAAMALGEKAMCLVDLGHHAPTVNIEMIVARLSYAKKLGGFHFNDSKYGDDDLDSGSINPFQLFLVFLELREAFIRDIDFNPVYMLDQSHNITDPIESLIESAIETQRAFIQSELIDLEALKGYRAENDALMASTTLKEAYRTDVSSILAEARLKTGGAISPVETYRLSGYRKSVASIRPISKQTGGGIV